MSEEPSNISENRTRERIAHLRHKSAYQFESPIKPRPGESVRFWKDSPSHVGKYEYAVDIIIPDPRVKPLPVYAPQSGKITALVQQYNEFGGPEYINQLNYITVQVWGEFYELCHIGKASCRFEVGDWVKKGQQIATTGVNGWMTDPRHLHFMVGRLKGDQGDFESLKINFESLEG